MEFTQHISSVDDEDVVFPSYESGNYAFMFDDEGWMIVHPKYWDLRGYDKNGKLVPAYSENTTEEDIQAGRIPFNLLDAGFIHPNYPEAAKAVRRAESGVLDTTNVGGSNKIMAFAPIPYSRGVYSEHGIFGGITIGAQVEQFHLPALSAAELIERQIQDYLLQSWLVISLTILLVIVFAYLLSNSIVRPLLLLTEGTRKMIQGGVSPQVQVSSSDEVGALADSFNTMVDELNNRRQRLLRTMQALRHSRKEIIRQRNFKNVVFENIDVGLLTIDTDCKVTSINGAACDVLQISRPVDDCHWHLLLHDWPELKNVLDGWLEIGQKEAQPFRDYVTFVRQGKTRTYLMAIHPLSFRKRAGWLLTIEDLTERVNIRHQMARMDRLASLGRMSAGIAHEVRNPLTGVSLLLDELHDRLLGQEVDQRLIRRALGEIERLETLVNDMLRFSTVPEPQLGMASIETVVRDSLFLLKNQLQRKNIELTDKIAADLPAIMIDTDRIKQVMLNLLNNAIDSMDEGGKLTVQTHLLKHAIQIDIRDNGIGISTDNLPLVFEPFFTSKRQGTGLGLAISYNIISDHGGDIQIESQAGEGTVVKVILPLSDSVDI
jgi:nitrogen fixation/metabolism regulation signal transduction histidine kinase